MNSTDINKLKSLYRNLIATYDSILQDAALYLDWEIYSCGSDGCDDAYRNGHSSYHRLFCEFVSAAFKFLDREYIAYEGVCGRGGGLKFNTISRMFIDTEPDTEYLDNAGLVCFPSIGFHGITPEGYLNERDVPVVVLQTFVDELFEDCIKKMENDAHAE